jgi:hypothetical protein
MSSRNNSSGQNNIQPFNSYEQEDGCLLGGCVPGSLVDVGRRFTGVYSLNHQDHHISAAAVIQKNVCSRE